MLYNFNHLSKNCTKNIPSFAKCSSSYLVNDCKSDVLSYVPCLNFCVAHNQSIIKNHAAWNSSCQVYQKVAKRFKLNVLGMK